VTRIAELTSGQEAPSVLELHGGHRNLIERAVITARDGRMNLDRGLPPSLAPAGALLGEPVVLTAEQLVHFERENLRRALEATGWQVSGPAGAAHLLRMAPSTLTSRMKALGVRLAG
jgi:transcriptional regulator with GAF, ATPase, and Fis domain